MNISSTMKLPRSIQILRVLLRLRGPQRPPRICLGERREERHERLAVCPGDLNCLRVLNSQVLSSQGIIDYKAGSPVMVILVRSEIHRLRPDKNLLSQDQILRINLIPDGQVPLDDPHHPEGRRIFRHCQTPR